MERGLLVLDVYNDAAECGLLVLGKQYLYDELEAEVNLGFDQWAYLMAEDVYSYFKNKAASQVLDKVGTPHPKAQAGSAPRAGGKSGVLLGGAGVQEAAGQHAWRELAAAAGAPVPRGTGPAACAATGAGDRRE